MRLGARHGLRHGHELARRAVAAEQVALGVQHHQAVRLAAELGAGPVQAQQQRAGQLLQQGVFQRARRTRHDMAQLGAFGHVHAGQVEHADAAPLRVEQRRAGAAVAAVGIEKMLPPVQPHRAQLAERGADGRGAHARLGQIDAAPGNGVRARVAVVHRAVDFEHHAARVRQEGKVAHATDRVRQVFQHRARRAQQAGVLIAAAAQGGGAHAVERQRPVRRASGLQAAAPGTRDPALDAGHGRGHPLRQQGVARLGDQGAAVGRVEGRDGHGGAQAGEWNAAAQHVSN